MEDDKKITIRLTAEEHRRYSVAMAQLGFKWQSLIEDLLVKWHSACRNADNPEDLGVYSSAGGAKLSSLSEEEAGDVEALLRARRSKDPLYAAISFILMKFRGGSRADTKSQAGETSEGSKRHIR